MRSRVRVRLLNKPKPNNYTESCGINVAGGWEGKKRVVPGEIWGFYDLSNAYQSVHVNY